jgi:hypothetical protein
MATTSVLAKLHALSLHQRKLSLHQRKIAVAIDFGTTFSGVAWAKVLDVRTLCSISSVSASKAEVNCSLF